MSPFCLSLLDSHSRSSSQTPSYLLDAHGRAVTPLIEPTPPPQPPLSSISHQHSTSARPANNSAENKLAAQELEELKTYKKAIGPTMGREGCVLVSEERRETFLGDEDFESVMYGSEFDDDPWKD